MKFINKFFIGLMALSLATTILAFCLDQTLLRADFVTAQADKSGIYTDLSKTLPKQLAGDSPSAPAIQAAFERIITPEYLQTNFDGYLRNLETAIRTGSAIPPLDLTDLVAQAKAAGLQLSPADEAKLTKQLTIQFAGSQNADQISKSQPPAKLYRRAASGKWLLALATLATMALVFVTAPHHRLKALGHGFLSATIWLGVYYVFFRLAPGIASHQLKTAKDFSLSGSVSKLITLAASGVAQKLLYAGIVTAALGAVLWILSMIMPHFGSGQGHEAKNEKRTPLPTMFHKG